MVRRNVVAPRAATYKASANEKKNPRVQTFYVQSYTGVHKKKRYMCIHAGENTFTLIELLFGEKGTW